MKCWPVNIPFKGEYEQAIMYAITNEDPEFISKIRADVPLEVEKIIDRALDKNPEKRFQSMQEMLKALEQAITDIHSGKSRTAVDFPTGTTTTKNYFPVYTDCIHFFGHHYLFCVS